MIKKILQLKYVQDIHHSYAILVFKTCLNIINLLGILLSNLSMQSDGLISICSYFLISSVILIIICFKWRNFIDYCSFYIALGTVIISLESYFTIYPSNISIQRNTLIFLMLIILNEKYKSFCMQVFFLMLIFFYFEIRHWNDVSMFYLTAAIILIAFFIYIYQYWIIESNLLNEKKLAAENNEFILLYQSIINNYPSALIAFEKISSNSSSNTPYFRLKFSNDISKNSFKIFDDASLAQLFEDIHLNTTDLFNNDTYPEYSPVSGPSKIFKKHLLESTINTEGTELKDKDQQKVPKIKKYLTSYKCKTLVESNGLILENSEEVPRKYRICLIRFYHKEKLNFLLNLEDMHLEEEIVHLRELESNKDEMLASITHDLRSPLSSMLKCIEFAKDSKNLLENHQNLELAESSGMMLMNLINDILDYSLMKKGKLKLNFSYFQLDKLLNETVNMMRVQGNLKNIDIIIKNQCKKFITFYSDYTRIKQVLVNLISNSLKFTKSAGQINLEISHAADPNLLRFSVIDNGIGIKPEIIPKLCKPFHSYDYEGSYNKEGIGLGLHICTSIVGQLGPEKQLLIDSIYEKGSKFSFTLFVNCGFRSEILIEKIHHHHISNYLEESKEILSEHPSSKNLPYVYLNHLNELKKEKNSRNHRYIDLKPKLVMLSPEKQDSEEVLMRDKNRLKRASSEMNDTCKFHDLNLNQFKISKPCVLNILLADDDVFASMLLKKMIMKFTQDNDFITFEIDSFYNGEEVVVNFEKKNKIESISTYDLVLLDCLMPIKDGFVAALELKKLINEKNYVRCPIFGCTAFQDSSKCYANGMDGTLIKPIEISKLFEILTEIYLNKSKTRIT